MTRKSRPTSPPDGIAAEHIDRRGGLHHHASVLSLIVLGAIVAWGASGYAGSRVERRSVAADALALVVSAPSLIRNGEVYETTFEVTARRRIGKLVFAVSPALWRETTTNSMLPQPGAQTFEDGMFRFAFEPLEAGATFIVKADLQINPSLFGDNAGEVVVLDGKERLASLPLRIRVLPLMDIVARASVMFAIVYLLLRLLGKRELGQMTPFEFVALIVIGDLIQQGVTQTDFSLTGALLAIATFSFWALVLSWAAYLSPRAEKLLEGEPRVLVQHGKILRHNLRRDRLTAGEIESEMRLAGIASLQDVEWAVLETSGKISFIRRDHADAAPRPPDKGPAA